MAAFGVGILVLVVALYFLSQKAKAELKKNAVIEELNTAQSNKEIKELQESNRE